MTSQKSLALADQYLIFIEQARQLRLELAADYLVMAAWLAYLKSRMLLPEANAPEGQSAEDMANALALSPQAARSYPRGSRETIRAPAAGIVPIDVEKGEAALLALSR